MSRQKEKCVIVSVRFSSEQYKQLETVCKHYRTDGKLSQGVRRAVEDIAKIIRLPESMQAQGLKREGVTREPNSNEGSSPTVNG
jgi:hypothetical protein